MKTLVRDGQSIDSLIPQNLRQMFYRNPNPVHRYARRNGYDPYSFTTKGLVLYLPLWALKGDAIKSVDRYQYACSVTGALWKPYGRWFDGTDDNINCGTPTSLNILDDLTLEVWAKPGSVTGINIFLSKWGAVAFCYIVYLNGTAFQFAPGSGREVAATFVADTSTWYHIVGTFDKDLGTNQKKLYRDGALDNEAIDVAGIVDAVTQPIIVAGDTEAAPPFALCDIGEVRIYNRALPAAEIAHNYSVTRWRYQ